MERITFEAALAMGPAAARELYRLHAGVPVGLAADSERQNRWYTKAEGCRLWDEQGQVYLDFAHGDLLNLGHNPPQVLEAVRRVEEQPALVQAGLSPVGAALLQNLAAVTPEPLRRAILTTSGAEAVEIAVALARAATARPGVVSCRVPDVTPQIVHGTAPDAGAGGAAAAHDPLQPPPPGWKTVPYGDLEALEAALAPGDVAALVIEPLGGDHGVIAPPAGYLRAAEGLCRKAGTLLIVNEADLGLGRAGSLFACEGDRIEPDILCLGPSLTGGVEPLGAAVTSEAVWR
ncbi:MAG TPA: aminotransferase class III-fold pyridoxal phosphate-dependent enzyme, partial [Limnochorda sp.]